MLLTDIVSKNYRIILLVVSPLLVPHPIQAESPNPADVQIRSMEYQGTGCPADSVVFNLSPDAKAVTLLFDNFIVSSGPQSEHGSRREEKNCKVKLKFKLPNGWQYSFFRSNIRGYASIDEGAVGRQRVRFRFGQGQDKYFGKLDLLGPFDDDYFHPTEVPLTSVSWSPCQRERHKLVIRISIVARSRNREKSALMTVDSVDGEVKHTYSIAWKRC